MARAHMRLMKRAEHQHRPASTSENEACEASARIYVELGAQLARVPYRTLGPARPTGTGAQKLMPETLDGEILTASRACHRDGLEARKTGLWSRGACENLICAFSMA